MQNHWCKCLLLNANDPSLKGAIRGTIGIKGFKMSRFRFRDSDRGRV